MRKPVILCAVLLLGIAATTQQVQAQSKRLSPAKARRARARTAPRMTLPQAKVALIGADVGKAIAGARALGTIGSQAAADVLLDALALGLDPSVAAAALGSLAARPHIRSFDTVTHYANHRNARVRAAAVGAAGVLKDSRARALVLGALRDGHKSVRAAAADNVRARKIKQGIEPLIELFKRGDDAAAPALAAMADPDLARNIGELIGTAPDGLVARCLGLILMRPDFKPEDARVQVVRSLGKVPGTDALEQLTTYVGSLPEKPPRQSRREAEALIEAKLTGGN